MLMHSPTGWCVGFVILFNGLTVPHVCKHVNCESVDGNFPDKVYWPELTVDLEAQGCFVINIPEGI